MKIPHAAVGLPGLTGILIHELKALGRGSDYFGACECCKKPASETFKSTVKAEVMRADGSRFFVSSPGLYGHENCLQGARS